MNITIKEELKKRKQLLIVPVGISMQPLFINSVTPVVVEWLNEKPKKNDIVLYSKPNNQIVLHRVISLRKEGVITRGDGMVGKGMFIPYKNIFGKCTAFYKGERLINVNNFWYKSFVCFWKLIYPFRCLIKLIKSRF